MLASLPRRSLPLARASLPLSRLSLAPPRPTAHPLRALCSSGTHDDFKPQVRAYAEGWEAVEAQIKRDIARDKVVLFMKGVPDRPMCGFSQTVCEVLKAEAVPFKGYNVLADPELRSGIKKFSSWPTIPQLFVNGEFVGGCDIVMEMYKSGELRALLKEAGVKE
ncbi:hypothetical protein AB1Y20_006515 [Prymnesium parvum]|uniref:Glutaredoxin domain-containing protein n=1 Tax=Prymnesium parvum TaxID=97485 RepID=A0AB34J0W2_PRYPA